MTVTTKTTWQDLLDKALESVPVSKAKLRRFERGPVDMSLLPEFMLTHTAHVMAEDTTDDDYDSDRNRQPARIEDADVIDSLDMTQPYHRPLLDIDFPAALVPSSTPGHHHLYLDFPMDWDDYVRILDLFGEIGILEEGYVAAAKRRGYTSARLPWVKKGSHDNG